MKSLICKKILGTVTPASASIYVIALSDMPVGTRIVMVTCDKDMSFGLPNSSDFFPTIPTGTIAYMDANDEINIGTDGAFNNLTVVFLG